LAGPTPSSSARGSIRHLQRLSVEQGYEPHHSGAAGFASPRETAEEEDEDEDEEGSIVDGGGSDMDELAEDTLSRAGYVHTWGSDKSAASTKSPNNSPLALQQQDSDDSERPSVGLSFTQGLKSFTLSVSRSFGGQPR